MTHRTYAILCDVLKAENLNIAKAYNWFNKLPIQTQRDVMKTGGAIKYILDNRTEWNK